MNQDLGVESPTTKRIPRTTARKWGRCKKKRTDDKKGFFGKRQKPPKERE